MSVSPLICEGKPCLSASWNGWSGSLKGIGCLRASRSDCYGGVPQTGLCSTVWEPKLPHSHRPSRGSRETESVLFCKGHGHIGHPAGLTQALPFEKRKRGSLMPQDYTVFKSTAQGLLLTSPFTKSVSGRLSSLQNLLSVVGCTSVSWMCVHPWG